MSTVTQLICNRFGGIRQRNSQFDSELITAKDIQNVELYYTGTNGGVGIRTMKGNVSAIDTLAGTEKIVDIFESVQKGLTLFLVYTETNTKGKFYLYNTSTNTLTLKKDNITKSETGTCNGFDIAQGWSDLFFFTNGKEMFTFEYGKLDENDELDEIVEMNDIYGRLKDEDNNPIQVMGLGATVFNNRLFIFNKNVLWYSVTENIYDFSTANDEWKTSAGYIETVKNITAIYEYLGALAVFYRDSSQLLTVSNGDYSLSDDSAGGCANYNSLVFHGTDLYFYDDTKKGVFAFKQVVNGDKTLTDNLAVDIQEELINIDSSNIDKIKTLSVVLSERNEVWWIIPTSETYEHIETLYAYVYSTNTIYADSPTAPTTLYNENGEEYTGADWTITSNVVKYSGNNATYTEKSNKTLKTDKPASFILIYDYLKGEWTKRKSQKINSVRVIDNELFSAGDDGRIFKEYATNLFNGQYIPHYYNCSPMNLGANNTLKVLVLPPRVTFNMPYVNKFKVKYVKNYNVFKKPKVKLIKTKYKNLLIWGQGFWGVNYFGTANTSAIGKFPNANFKVLEIFIFTDAADQNFSIKNIEFSKIKVKQI